MKKQELKKPYLKFTNIIDCEYSENQIPIIELTDEYGRNFYIACILSNESSRIQISTDLKLENIISYANINNDRINKLINNHEIIYRLHIVDEFSDEVIFKSDIEVLAVELTILISKSYGYRYLFCEDQLNILDDWRKKISEYIEKL